LLLTYCIRFNVVHQYSAIIGTSAFNTAGQVLALAGPVGLLLAIILTGAIAASTGKTIEKWSKYGKLMKTQAGLIRMS
jgi:hypothetical protein